MKYAFVTLSILAIWIAIALIVNIFNLASPLLPLVGLILTFVLFLIGFEEKR